MNRHVYHFLFWFSTVTVLFLSAVPSVFSAEKIQLPVTPISQRFSPADWNGDTGITDCMPASLTVALQSLAASNSLASHTKDFSYRTIREITRGTDQELGKGVAPHILTGAVASMTDDQFDLIYIRVQSDSWETLLTEELVRKHPVIVHVSDRNTLYGLPGLSDVTHVVVVTGIDENSIIISDSWDGQVHHIPKEVFAKAWGSAPYPWFGFRFEEKKPTFEDILSSYKKTSSSTKV